MQERALNGCHDSVSVFAVHSESLYILNPRSSVPVLLLPRTKLQTCQVTLRRRPNKGQTSILMAKPSKLILTQFVLAIIMPGSD